MRDEYARSCERPPALATRESYPTSLPSQPIRLQRRRDQLRALSGVKRGKISRSVTERAFFRRQVLGRFPLVVFMRRRRMGGWAHGQTGDDGWPSMRAVMSFNRRKQLDEGGN